MGRWSALVLILMLAGSGCTQSFFAARSESASWRKHADFVPPPLPAEAEPSITPDIPQGTDPSTIADPERPPRFLSLQEALALALENGNTGIQALQANGQVSDDLAAFAGRGLVGTDSVRVLAMTPAIAGAGIDLALSRFDAQWQTGMSWNHVDEPVQGLSSFQNGDSASFSTTLAKPLPTGGVAGITFSTDYSLLTNPPGGFFSVLNPSYRTQLQAGFEQPLLRGSGVEINQLLPNFPGSSLFPGINGRGTPEGILITRLRFDQQRADFERAIHFLVLNVESAYWRLYGAYVQLYSAEQGLRQSHSAWNIGKVQYEGGKIDSSQFALLRAQFEQFRAARLSSLGQVLDNERTLRVLVGMPVEDGYRLVPANSPTLTPYQPNWQASLEDCLTLRPELVVGRKELEVRTRELQVSNNYLLPDLRFQSTYSAVGLGTRLDGPGMTVDPTGQPTFSNSLAVLNSNHFNNWTVGLNLNVPVGYRAANAAVRQSQLALAQSYHALKHQELRAQTVLAKQYRLLVETNRLIEIRRLAREALAEQLEVRFRKYVAGAKDSTIEFLLDAQRQWAAALTQEYQAIVDYNIALASFEFARGTILKYNNVHIMEGPLPACALVRAADCERDKTSAVVLREKSLPLAPSCANPATSCTPHWSPACAPSVPRLLANSTPVPLNLDAGPGHTKLGVVDQESTVVQPLPAGPAPATPARLALPETIESTPPALPGARLGLPSP